MVPAEAEAQQVQHMRAWAARDSAEAGLAPGRILWHAGLLNTGTKADRKAKQWGRVESAVVAAGEEAAAWEGETS